MISPAVLSWEAWYVRSVDGQSIETMRLPIVAVADHTDGGGVALVMSANGSLVRPDRLLGGDAPWVFVGVSDAGRWDSIEDAEFCGVSRSDSTMLVQQASAFALRMGLLRKEVAGSP